VKVASDLVKVMPRPQWQVGGSTASCSRKLYRSTLVRETCDSLSRRRL